MTNYCTIEEAWNTHDFSSSNNQNQNQNQNQQNTIENSLAKKNNNCFNNNFEHMEQFQNFVVERSGEMSSEEEEDSGEEYYNNSYVPFNTQDVVSVSQNHNSNNKNSNNHNSNNQNSNNQNSNNKNSNNQNSNNKNSNNQNSNNQKPLTNQSNDELKKVVEDLNTKMNFILDKMNSDDRKPNFESKELENNVHDLVLFVLFGILVVMIFDGFAKLVLKFAKR
jgi:hypothetical protein